VPITNAIAIVAVRDLKKASAWYERLLGRPADSRPMPEVAEWKFHRGGWLQVYQLPERAGRGSVTLAVRDMETQASKLEKLGIDTRRHSDRVETLLITDPDGNLIALAEARNPGMAR
jgi:predicted enzyme related to lactoylglutathione lyase